MPSSSTAFSPPGEPATTSETACGSLHGSEKPCPLCDVQRAIQKITAGFYDLSDITLRVSLSFQEFQAACELLGDEDLFLDRDGGPTTACFECGTTVRTEHVWLKKSDPNVALCESCFRMAERAGRAKEEPSAHPGR